MSRKHPLANAKTLSPAQLKGVPLHAFSEEEYPDYVPRLRATFRSHRVTLQFKDNSAKSVAAILSSIEAEAGLAVLAHGSVHMLPRTLVVKSFRPAIGTISILVGTPIIDAKPAAVRFIQNLMDVASTDDRSGRSDER
jgi:LysR substrate binding domain